MKIILMGYMGCGKSTIGKYLAAEKKVAFIDLDAYIEEKEGMSIKQLFSDKGEIYFRVQEAIYLKELLVMKKSFVLSLGGGTPCYGNTMNAIIESGVQNFYLKTTIPILVERLKKEKQSRPLIANLSDEAMLEYVGKHLFERAPFYEQSGYKISTDKKTVEAIVDEINSYLH